MIKLHETPGCSTGKAYPDYHDANAIPPRCETPSVLSEYLSRLRLMVTEIKELSCIANSLLEKLAGSQVCLSAKVGDKPQERPGLLGETEDQLEQLNYEILCLREAINVLSRLA